MKYFVILIIVVGIMSCKNERPNFQPIEEVEKLTTQQIDSVLTKFSFKYDSPIFIDSTSQMMIPLSTEIITKRKKFSSDGYYVKDFPRYWNVIFHNRNTGENHLLTKKKTRISLIHANRKKEGKSLQSLVLYQLKQDDYNQDGRLNHKDPESLYASNRFGKELTRISPEKEDLLNFEIIPHSNQIFLKTLRDNNQDSIFNHLDKPIIYLAELKDNTWQVSEILTNPERENIEKQYLNQWLSSKK